MLKRRLHIPPESLYPVDDWRIEGLHLLDPANWDHRMIYTSAG